MKLCQVGDQYKAFSELKRDDVKKLMDWCQKQAHLPKNITGETRDLNAVTLVIRDEPVSVYFRIGSNSIFTLELQ